MSTPLREARLPTADALFLGQLPLWVREPLHGRTERTNREVIVALEELLTNAYQHAQPPFTVRLSLLRHGHVVRIEVDDGTPSVRTGWLLRRGLLAVRGLCSDWGVTPTGAGKTVWAELPIPGTVDEPVADADERAVNGHRWRRE